MPYVLLFFTLMSQSETRTVPLPPTSGGLKGKDPKKGGLVVGYLERSPYVQNVTKTALSFLWETPTYEKCVIKLTAASTGVEHTLTSGPSRHHEVRFTGLSPQTRYAYRVESIQGVWAGTVETAPGTDTPFSFLVFGDNRNGHQAHRNIIKAMTVEAASFFINTGDLTADGADKANYIRFLRIEAPLMKRIPLFPVVGNHENAFAGGGLAHWRRFFALPTDGPEKELVYSFVWGNSRFFFLDTNKPFVGSRQAKWFREQLQATAFDAKVKHIFVFVHQSPYTSGPHGPHQGIHEAGLVDDMRRFGVDMTFAAHDHIYERGRVDGLNYIVTGGGGAPTYFVRTHKPFSILAEPTYHYCRLNVQGDTVEFSAHHSDGSLIDFFTIKKVRDGDNPRIEVLSEHRKGLHVAPSAPKLPVPPKESPPAQMENEPEPQTLPRSRFGSPIPYVLGLLGSLVLISAFAWSRLRRRR